MWSRALLLGSITSLVTCRDIPLVTFDGVNETKHQWRQMNDPVMGGKSTGTFKIDTEKSLGILDGEVANVPFLHAPGFIKADVCDSAPLDHVFPDINGCKGIEIVSMADSNYTGWRFSFGRAHPKEGKRYAYGHKADFYPPVGEFGSVVIPLMNFTNYWDDATGDAIVTCTQDSRFCPDEKTLHDMRTLGFWAEGVLGKVHLELKSVTAVDCPERPTTVQV
mmetsp:Transcript_62190/g.148363  ORF Transcript_62190/g.148363 Transcript_62190/m.148363 type:complete len:221 (-) Transcript_62190:70-732(-)|eukprot:CAMPEP_0178422324 /NCGR_PEP_ID=MMETSP0689_2-20121128/27112_1 /TAXON_ID=160604 /ORGANISM="Amphidinium massartii, Strain CS-259" /LENGTH=220 /DNA_ID=CAMNT_0020043879 /DNA_START=64 /DNA_END=726 /DNA_ORIENTATION=-